MAMPPAEIGLDHQWVLLNRAWRAFSDLLPKI
jgi:hypothetical protein